jgi:hypothetical protein
VTAWDNNDMRATDLAGAEWRKSSRSTANSNCVEVGFADEIVATRDSKNPVGPMLKFGTAGWAAFLRNLTVR